MGVPVPAKPVGLLGKEADLGELGHHGVHPDEARPGQLLGAALAVEGLALGALEEGLLGVGEGLEVIVSARYPSQP